MYQALYRKYRPKTFLDVCGQSVITQTLQNEFASEKYSHAYLFTGVRGSGKTTCSKIIAKTVNCLNPQQGNPCCECEICRGIDNESITDVMEIDAASNSGVDYMRELREQAFYQPVRCKKRVYIIDETHMLSTEAFNALLKVMEEPPGHVLFILATTEVHKVPATIISRCQRFDFKRIEPEDIANRLKYISDCEGFSISSDAAMLIARLSDGGMRDAISLLDQCWSHASAIDVQVVADCAGLLKNQSLFDLSDSIAESNCTQVLLQLDEICQSSTDMQRFCEQLLHYYRNLMIASCSNNPEALIVCLPDELEQYRKAASQYELSRLIHIIECLQDTFVRMGRTQNKRLELEISLIQLCIKSETEITQLQDRILKLENLIAGGKLHSASESLKSDKPTPPSQEFSSVSFTQNETMQKKAHPFLKWPEVLEKLKGKNQALYGTLIGSTAYISDDLVLIDFRNELFTKFVRENEYAKQNIHECIIEATGSKHRIGPYKPDLYQVETPKDPLDSLLKKADSMGVPVKMDGD